MRRAAAAIERISADSHRAIEILDRVRRLSRGEKPHVAPFDINEVVRDIVELAHNEITRHDIALDLDLTPGLPMALADRVQIQQVIGNLVLNAIEAIQEKDPPVRSLKINTALTEGARLQVAVRDSGGGIAPADQERLFDAFWTTKKGASASDSPSAAPSSKAVAAPLPWGPRRPMERQSCLKCQRHRRRRYELRI